MFAFPRCPIQPPRDDKKLHFAWASSHCQPFTSFGKKQKLRDPRCLAFLLWIHERLTFQEDAILFENAESLPASIFRNLLSTDFHIVAGVLRPEVYGYPVKRPRCMIMCLRKARFIWGGPQLDSEGIDVMESFNRIFARDLACDADTLIWEDKAGYIKHLRKMLKCKGSFCKSDVDISELHPSTYLSPSSKRFYQAYEAQNTKKDSSGAFVCDLYQNPAARNISGEVLPSLTTKTLRYSFYQRPILDQLRALGRPRVAHPLHGHGLQLGRHDAQHWGPVGGQRSPLAVRGHVGLLGAVKRPSHHL